MPIARLDRLTPFGEWLADHRTNYAQAAVALGVTRAHVQALAVGKSTPGLGLAARIEEWTRSKTPGDAVLIMSWLPYRGRGAARSAP